MHNTVHFILQGKGGIGKSLVATLLAQYFQKEENVKLVCFDTDQENDTFARYKALGATHLKVYDSNNIIDARKFDELIEALAVQEGTFVIDTGANTFSNLLAYLIEGDYFNLLKEHGKTVYVHTIVGGGDTLVDTANGFNSIVKSVDAKIILWLNEHFGALEVDGKKFTDTKVFKEHQDKLHGVVMLQNRNPATYGVDLKLINVHRLTIAEAMTRPEFNLAAKSRLKQIAEDVFSQLRKITW